MTQSLPIPAGMSITQYDHIKCIRPTDGLEIRAQRVVTNTETPVRWTFVIVDRLGQWRYIERIENGERATYSTNDIMALAKNAGFGDWEQSQVAEISGYTLIDGQYKPVRLQQFQVPDLTPYPEWVDIAYLHNKGLSDATILKLVLENTNFRRVNGERIDYDMNKVYNHPKVRAFRSRLTSGQATAISYENILNN